MDGRADGLDLTSLDAFPNIFVGPEIYERLADPGINDGADADVDAVLDRLDNPRIVGHLWTDTNLISDPFI